MTSSKISIKSDLADTRIYVFSHYRDAELRGARLLLNLLKHFSDKDTLLKLNKHLADETRHALLWTERVVDLGSTPQDVDGLQRQLGRKLGASLGLPKRLVDILALTLVVEERAQKCYREHLAMHGLDAKTRKVLIEVTKDEAWHLHWIEQKYRELCGHIFNADKMLERYRVIESAVFQEMEDSI